MMMIIIMRNSQKSMTASIQACLPTAHYEIRTFMLPVDSGFASQLKNLQKVHKHDDDNDDDDDDDSDDDGEDNYGDELQQ